ncbi:MAG TPA: hypothetical protein PKW98_04060 [Candidatus Wallbacteria bacterium]|nr:MAG: hypothetical protein BWY32_00228 [bacterium ADurb.Bin243]HPG56967.1 hypothetical protein [Candidatus Wallbacteria bacterium]
MCSELCFLRVAVCPHCALAATIDDSTEPCSNIDTFSKIMHYNLFNYCISK